MNLEFKTLLVGFFRHLEKDHDLHPIEIFSSETHEYMDRIKYYPFDKMSSQQEKQYRKFIDDLKKIRYILRKSSFTNDEKVSNITPLVIQMLKDAKE